MFDDDPNLSDAILLALSNAGWIGPLVRRGSAPPPPKKRKREYRHVPKPQGLRTPRGVTWNAHNGRYVTRFHIDGVRIPIGTCGATQAELDELGARWQQAAALRDAGAGPDDIRAALGREAA